MYDLYLCGNSFRKHCFSRSFKFIVYKCTVISKEEGSKEELTGRSKKKYAFYGLSGNSLLVEARILQRIGDTLT